MSIQQTFQQSRFDSDVPVFYSNCNNDVSKVKPCWEVATTCNPKNCSSDHTWELLPGNSGKWDTVHCPGADATRMCTFLDLTPCSLSPDEDVVFLPEGTSYRWVDQDAHNETKDGQMICSWPEESFQVLENIQGYLKRHGDKFEKGGILDTAIYPTFCGQKNVSGSVAATGTGELSVTSCPLDPAGDNQEMKECSFFKTTVPKALKDFQPEFICDQWVEKGTDGVIDGTMETYCQLNETRDCLCINPGILDPELEKLINALPPNLASSQGCWFTPCAADSPYLKTSSIDNERETCDKDNICEEVINIANSNNINLNNIKQFIRCNNDVPPSGGLSDLEIFVIVFVILIIIIGVVVAIYKSTKKS